MPPNNQQQDLIDRARSARAAADAADQLQRAAIAAGTLSEKIRYALIPSLAKVGGGAIGAAAGQPVAVFTALTARIVSVLSPLAILNTTLNSTSSGFGVFQRAISVLGATLGPILLPGFALLGAAALTLGDLIHERLAPVLKEWMTWILTQGIEGVKTFVGALTDAAEAVKNAWEFLKKQKDFVKESGNDLLPSFNDAIKEAAEKLSPGVTKNDQLFDEFKKRISGGEDIHKVADDVNKRIQSGNAVPVQPVPGSTGKQESGVGGAAAVGGVAGATSKEAPKAAPGGTVGKFIGNLDKFANELQKSNGPAASFQGVAQASRGAQLAALNRSDFETTILQRTQEAINALKEAISEIKKMNMGAG